MPRKEDDDDAVLRVNPTADAIFTACFALEVLLVFAALLIRSGGYALMPVSPAGAALIVALFIGGCFAFVNMVKRGASKCGKWLSLHVLPSHPLKKRKTLHKFEDQIWQLVVHVAMMALEYYILFCEVGEEPVAWWTSYSGLWTPHPHSKTQVNSPQVNNASVHVLYALQLAIWIVTCFQHRFVDEHRKDYFLMYTHHLVTIALVALSYYYNYVRIGVIVLYAHDISDIIIDLLKLFNYCQLEGPKGLFLVELAFITNFATWAYYRFYLLGVHIIWGTIVYGDGACEKNIRTLPTHECLPFYWQLVRGSAGRGANSMLPLATTCQTRSPSPSPSSPHPLALSHAGGSAGCAAVHAPHLV